MNDQWSGKTLRNERRAKLAAPRRSSNQSNNRLIIGAQPAPSRRLRPPSQVPEAGSHRLGKIGLRPQHAARVDVDRQLRKWPGGRPEYGFRPVQDVECGLMAGTLELMQARRVQP